MRGPLAGAFLIFLAGCSKPCGNTIVDAIPSPDHSKRAVVFQRDCGASDMEVSVLGVNESLAAGAGNAAATEGGNLDVRARWKSADEVVVTVPAAAKLRMQQPQVGSVKITYERTP